MPRNTLRLACAASALTLAAPLAAETARERLPQIFTMTPTGVNLQTGSFVHSETDLTIGSLSFVRSWRAAPSFQPPGEATNHHSFGEWNHNWGLGARVHTAAVYAGRGFNVYADGKVYQFFVNQDGSWMPRNLDQHNNSSQGASLIGAINNNLVFRNQAGDEHFMNSANMTTHIVHADGSRVDLLYDIYNRLTAILSNRGEAIALQYNSAGELAAACGLNRATHLVGPSGGCGGAPLRVDYGYTTYGSGEFARQMLSGVTNAAGETTSMLYGGGNLTCITLPNSGTCRISNVYGPQPGDVDVTFTAPDQVRRQTTATNEVWTYEYENMSQYSDYPPRQGNEVLEARSRMIDPAGNETWAIYGNGFLLTMEAPDGVTTYGWAMLNPVQFTRAGVGQELLHYDLRNNLVSHTRRAAGEADIVTSATYPASVPGIFPTGCDAASQRLCNKPITTTDARGGVTDYTYDPAHGGVLTVTRPAPTQGAVRPQTRYSYTPLRAGILNSASQLVPAEPPVWVLTAESQCVTGDTCFWTGNSDEIRTTYQYGADGTADALRLRGVAVTGNNVTSRTCYSYDNLGNRIGETGPGAALPTCP